MAQNLNRTRLLALKPQEKPYKVTDGGGLFLEVLPSGSMIWRYQYLLGGKREKVTIGAYRDAGDAQTRIGITLEAARDKHAEYKRLVRAGEVRQR